MSDLHVPILCFPGESFDVAVAVESKPGEACMQSEKGFTTESAEDTEDGLMVHECHELLEGFRHGLPYSCN